MRDPFATRTCPGSNGSIMPFSAMRRIHRSDLILMPLIPSSSGVFNSNGWKGRTGRQCGSGEPCRSPAREIDIRLSERALRLRHHGGLAAVGLLADADIERELGEQVDLVLLSHSAPAARAEDVFLVAAFRTDMRAHVLDDAEHGHSHLL